MSRIKQMAKRIWHGVHPPTKPEMVLVYHMGKVGSTSIFESLVAAGVPNLHHLNRLSPENIAAVRQAHQARQMPLPPGDEEGLRVFAELNECPHRVRCISPVRDPIRRNLSAFFFTSTRFVDDGKPPPAPDVDALRSAFLAEYDHDVPLTWFDVELKRVLGVDVYSQPFVHAEGKLALRQGDTEVLLLKCEMEDERKAAIIGDFMNLPNFALRNENMAKDKRYAGVYKEFLSTLTLPEAYVERICNARYTRHFYTAAEIQAMCERWTEKPSPN